MNRKTITVLSLLSLLVLAVAPSFAQTPPFTRTVIVPGNASPTANGTALLTALAGITTASAADPWKILVEPGIFDLQTSTLQLKDFIDIQGSGRDVTYVRSAAAAAVFVPGGVNAELRDLTVQSFTDANGIAVQNESSQFLLTQVNLEAVSAGSATGFTTKGSNPRVSEVFARVAAEEGNAFGARLIGGGPVISEFFALIEVSGGNGTGYEISDGSFATLLEVRAQIQDVFGNAAGISVNASKPSVQNCNLRILGPNGSTENRGFFVTRESVLSIKDCIVSSEGGVRATGLWVDFGSQVDANESSFTGGAAGTSFGVLTARGNVQLDRSTAEGDTQSVRQSSFADVVTVGASRLVGPVLAAGTLSCAQSYNGANVDLNPACL